MTSMESPSILLSTNATLPSGGTLRPLLLGSGSSVTVPAGVASFTFTADIEAALTTIPTLEGVSMEGVNVANVYMTVYAPNGDVVGVYDSPVITKNNFL